MTLLTVGDQWQRGEVVDGQSASREFPPPTLMMSRPSPEWSCTPHEEPETMTSSFNSDVLTSVTQCADTHQMITIGSTMLYRYNPPSQLAIT
ncbi:hypothetical protein DAPPUDRAFT_232914 [Daphnia pulex]|uniref:Uncharacterized protein n=1 Tax=Daphnia pulex TaxID=6669 RepID=E9FSP2_DAPPU|nr:hypothetical protein DAPPUDRAFT_232914 [Daphnia pulex]|eukprot:EFX89790.1 hypothetical protein DAPPUDRAFT_232914 [Daphnia pulex]